MGKNVNGKEVCRRKGGKHAVDFITTGSMPYYWVHASSKTTMDRYVHVTDHALVSAVRQFESASAQVQLDG